MNSLNLTAAAKFNGLSAGRPAAPAAPTTAPASTGAASTTARDARVGSVAPATTAPGTAANPVLAAELRLATCYHADADVFAANLAAASLQDMCQLANG